MHKGLWRQLDVRGALKQLLTFLIPQNGEHSDDSVALFLCLYCYIRHLKSFYCSSFIIKLKDVLNVGMHVHHMCIHAVLWPTLSSVLNSWSILCPSTLERTHIGQMYHTLGAIRAWARYCWCRQVQTEEATNFAPETHEYGKRRHTRANNADELT